MADTNESNVNEMLPSNDLYKETATRPANPS